MYLGSTNPLINALLSLGVNGARGTANRFSGFVSMNK
jgi:hypothetical protein